MIYKVVDKKYTDCDLKTMELLECALIGACAVIRLHMVFIIHPVSFRRVKGCKMDLFKF